MRLANAALVGILTAAVALLLAAQARQSTSVLVAALFVGGFLGFGASLPIVGWGRHVVGRHEQANARKHRPDQLGS